MRKLFLILILGFFLPSFVYTQSSDTWVDQLEFSSQAGLAKFSFDGELTHGDFGLGVVYHTPKAIIEPSLVINTNIDFSSSTNETEIHVGIMPQVTIMKTLSLGVWYDWWKTGKGLQGWTKNTAGFSLNLVF